MCLAVQYVNNLAISERYGMLLFLQLRSIHPSALSSPPRVLQIPCGSSKNQTQMKVKMFLPVFTRFEVGLPPHTVLQDKLLIGKNTNKIDVNRVNFFVEALEGTC